MLVQPQIISYSDLSLLQRDNPGLTVENNIDLALNELFDISHPSKKDSKTDDELKHFSKELTAGQPDNWGQWIFYPWLNKVVHLPAKKELRALRTSRNRNLITAEEQAKLYESAILIVGMSVGSNVVEALVSQGIGGKLILVDMDIIEPSNLNRIRSPYHQVGLDKVEAVSRRMWEIDPYLEIIGYSDGLNEKILSEILAKHPPDVIIDEMDELRMKIKLRETAKAKSTPVVMAADDGDNALIDIERYDLDNNLALFNGRIPEAVLEKIKKETVGRAELGIMIGRYFVGTENIPLRMFQSLAEVGKTLPSWPQLGGAAALSGVSLAYVAKKILLNLPLRTGRVLVSLDEKLSLEHLDDNHRQALEQFRRRLEAD